MFRPSIATERARADRSLQRQRGRPYHLALCLALSLVATAAFAVGTRQVFVTSTYGPADFSLWSDVTLGTAGPEAADSICSNLAAAAGLDRPGAFRAWLSDSLDDAWCRVQDLSGTRDGGCDAAPAPPGAGPWARTSDGARWAGALSALSDDQGPLVPIDRDEHGVAVPELELFWTGTDETGRAFDRLPSALCADWTSSAAASASLLGSTFETRFAWTISFGGSCASHRRLVCLETGAGGGRPPIATLGPAALAFVTLGVGSGDLSTWPGAGGWAGLAAADAICRGEAVASRLPAPQSFVAWLSTSTLDARGRLPTSLAWRRIDGTGVALSRADLLDGRLAAPINETAGTAYLPRPPAWSAPSWTGTAYDGIRLLGETYLDWTSTSEDDSGLSGVANSAAADWTDGQPFACNAHLPLYCFSTVEILFWGNFESGDAEDWSPALP
jgi:hypothetical protein